MQHRPRCLHMPSVIDIAWHDPADPAAKPPSVAKMVFRFARGARFDITVPMHCKASNADLMARGKEACPAGSRLAAGELLTDNGSPAGAPPRETRNEYTSFSNGNELIGLAESANPPTRVVGRSKLEDGFPGSRSRAVRVLTSLRRRRALRRATGSTSWRSPTATGSRSESTRPRRASLMSRLPR